MQINIQTCFHKMINGKRVLYCLFVCFGKQLNLHELA